MTRYFFYINDIFKVLNFKNRFYVVLFFLNSIFLAFLETLSIGVLAVYVGFLSNPDLIINKIPIIFLKNYLYSLDRLSLIFEVSIVIIFSFLIKNLLVILSGWFSLKIRQSITSDNSNEIFKYILNSDYKTLLNSTKSVLTYKIYNEVKRVAGFIVAYNLILKEIILVLSLSISLLLVSKFIFLGIVSIFFLFFLISIISAKGFLRKSASKINKHSSLMLMSISEIIDNLSLIKISSKNNFFIKKYLNQLNLQIRYGNIKRLIQIMPKSIFEIVGVLLVILFVLFEIHNQNMKTQELLPTISFVALAAARLAPTFGSINSNFSAIIFNEKTFVEFTKNKHQRMMININAENDENKFNSEFNDKLELNFDNVSFSYNDEKKILDKIDYNFRENFIYAITGKSGSGKSTLIQLLMGLLDPTNGKINLNKKNIKSNKLILYKLIGYVPQKIFLLDDDLESNIAMGTDKVKINKDRLKECIELANLEELIQSDEIEKFKIVEQGKNLSGGQIQSIGLARALYADPKILIFDEPTNNLDLQTKEKFVENLKKLSKNRICIIVTHDNELIQNCDKITIIKEQKINEQK